MRRVKFKNGEYYHIFNRGVDKRKIFLDKYDYIRFLTCLREFNTIDSIDSLYRLNQIRKIHTPNVVTGLLQDCSNPVTTHKIVEIICFALLPNHYHLLLSQISDNGISKFIHKLAKGYSRYFNIKTKRSGTLFQGTFKSVEIKTDSYLQYLSGYINGNAEIHGIAKAENWPWSSYADYLGKWNDSLCDKNIILNEFESPQEYKIFSETIVEESKQRKDEIKHYTLE
jgi:putative transposase